jgi:hypothetical protein
MPRDAPEVDRFCRYARRSFGMDCSMAEIVWPSMASDPKVWRLAQLIVEKHADGALAVVTERALERMIVMDYPLAMVWTRVAEAVHTLLPGARPAGSQWRAQAPLNELMDDPVMGVVVQDDEERRQEVHDVLRSAKRKLRSGDN